MSFLLLNLVPSTLSTSSLALATFKVYLHSIISTPFLLKLFLGPPLAFSVTSFPLPVSKIATFRTPECLECCCWQLAKLPSYIIATPPDTVINPFFQNPLQKHFQECIPNLPHKCTFPIKISAPV